MSQQNSESLRRQHEELALQQQEAEYHYHLQVQAIQSQNIEITPEMQALADKIRSNQS